jgi:hypothetical protein
LKGLGRDLIKEINCHLFVEWSLMPHVTMVMVVSSSSKCWWFCGTRWMDERGSAFHLVGWVLVSKGEGLVLLVQTIANIDVLACIGHLDTKGISMLQKGRDLQIMGLVSEVIHGVNFFR